MKTMRHSLRMRMTALLLALVCVVGLLPISAMAAGTDTIKLERFGMSGVSYTSASLGTCTLHQMYYDYGGETTPLKRLRGVRRSRSIPKIRRR